MEPAVQEVLETKDILFQIFPAEVRRTLDRSLRAGSFYEAASLIIEHSVYSSDPVEWIASNPGALFCMRIDCSVDHMRYDADYNIELFATGNTNDYFLLKEFGDILLERRTRISQLDANIIINVGTIDSAEPLNYDQKDALIKILKLRDDERIIDKAVEFDLVYIEKYKFLLDKYSDLRDEDPETFTKLLRTDILEFMDNDYENMTYTDDYHRPSYVPLSYWLHLNCASVGIEDFSFIEQFKDIYDWRQYGRENAKRYEEECSQLYEILREKLEEVLR